MVDLFGRTLQWSMETRLPKMVNVEVHGTRKRLVILSVGDPNERHVDEAYADSMIDVEKSMEECI